jgi:hypothetical protein
MTRNKPLIYVSTDIETNGQQIGKNSILSLASAAFLDDKTLVSTFSANLDVLPDGEENEITMAWWQKYPEAWLAARQQCIPPEEGMNQYVNWLNELPGRPIFVGYPIAFDFSFVVYYLERFTGKNPFGFSAIDLRSLTMGLNKAPFLESSKHHWPTHWFENKPHTHIALDDAIEQGTVFCNMLAEFQRK